MSNLLELSIGFLIDRAFSILSLDLKNASLEVVGIHANLIKASAGSV